MNKKLKLAIFYGTRPEFLKVISIIELIRNKYVSEIDLSVVSLGQHKELLVNIEKEFNFRPDINFKIIDKAKSLPEVYSKSIEMTNSYLLEHPSDVVMAQGDTASVFSVSWACYLNKIPFIHLEAGMRTNNRYSPFPEEMNRRTCSCIADTHICWTEIERTNLLLEGFSKRDILVTGNTLIDTLLEAAKKKMDLKKIIKSSELISKINSGAKIVLITQHRRENFGNKHKEIFKAICEILKTHKEFIAIYPVHLNPQVRSLANEVFRNVDRMFLTEPLSYFPFTYLMSKSSAVITDSGGLQEEAPSFGVPVLITRDTTERPLVVSEKKAFLVGSDREKIVKTFEKIFKNWNYDDKSNPYGDGKSSEKVVNLILKRYRNR